MRMLLFVFLLIPVVAMANKTDCPGKPENTCKSTPGCIFENECRNCAQGSYCSGNNAEAFCFALASGEYNTSDEGAESENDCYKSNQNCIKDNGTNDSNCRQYYDGAYKCGNNHDINAHNESDTCYYNEMNCEQFTSSCNSVSETATWANGQWNVSGCKCTANNVTISDKNCTGHAEYGATTQTIANIGGTITFDQTPTSYYCTSCIGDDASTAYYANTTDNPENCTIGHVCKCDELTTKGWYRKGNCGSNQNWNSQSDICTLGGKCQMGQTTASIGDTQCIYTNDTKICDSNGCTSLSNPSTWVPNN